MNVFQQSSGKIECPILYKTGNRGKKKRILPKNLFQPIVINVGINLLQSTQSRKYAKINPRKNPLKPNFCMGLVEKCNFY